MTAPVGAAHVASPSSKLIFELDPGYGSWHLEPGLKGLLLGLPGRIDEISSLSKKQREDSLVRDLSKNMTQFREKIPPLFWVGYW